MITIIITPTTIGTMMAHAGISSSLDVGVLTDIPNMEAYTRCTFRISTFTEWFYAINVPHLHYYLSQFQ